MTYAPDGMVCHTTRFRGHAGLVEADSRPSQRAELRQEQSKSNHEAHKAYNRYMPGITQRPPPVEGAGGHGYLG